jgi:RNA polymerase sigma-70 factor (ECF subfamily)
MEPSDNELILQIQRGNALAFEQLVFRYDRKVLSMSLRFTGNGEDAKDIYQEVFMRVYRALPKFEFRSQFSTWLYRIVKNVCLTHQQKGKRDPQISLDQEIDSGEGSGSRTLLDTLADKSATDRGALDTEISTHVENAMNSLSPKQKMVFVMRHYEGYKLKEIASVMKCTEGTVKKYLFTATERMRKNLKEVFTS